MEVTRSMVCRWKKMGKAMTDPSSSLGQLTRRKTRLGGHARLGLARTNSAATFFMWANCPATLEAIVAGSRRVLLWRRRVPCAT